VRSLPISHPGSETKTITDMAGRTVEVPTEVNSVSGTVQHKPVYRLPPMPVDKMAGVREMEQQ